MGKKAWKILCIILTLLMFSWTVSIIATADTVPTGYTEVYTKEDLDNVRNNLNGNYILMNDIIFTDADFQVGGKFYNDGMGWVPIGAEFTKWSADYYEFNGVFDGNGYSIRNIKMNRTPTAYTAYPSKIVYFPDGTKGTFNAYHSFGLFACNAGTIENLNISVDFTINANPYAVAGGICGVNSGLISNCKTSGTLFINKTNDSGDSYLGGIAGLIDGGTITLCANEAKLSGKNEYSFPYINCGGIIGGSTGLFENTVSYCYNTGTINPESVSDGYLGGIAARASNGLYYNGFSLVIENCYNAGTIGTATCEGRIAGICGEGYHEGTKIISCYNVGQILSSGKTAGIVYERNNSTDCYYLNSSADSLWCNYWSSTLYVINSLQELQMKTEEAFGGFDFDDVWIVDAKSDYPYPQLRDNLQSNTVPERHNYAEEVTTQATCTQNGTKTLVCTDCGFEISFTVEAKGHIYSTIVVIAPTCTQQGFTAHSCECGDSYTTDIVAADSTKHAGETEIRDAASATCVKNGYTGDTYCLDCYVKIETGDIIPATGMHSYTSEITTPPTHLTTGIETYTCECGDTYSEIVEKIAKHSYTSEITTPATHLTDGVETFTCPCGDSYTNPVENLPGHTYESVVTPPTCTAEGYTTYTCNCGDNYISDYTEQLSHLYKTTTIKATLTTAGKIENKCSLCDKVKSTTTINAVDTVKIPYVSYTYRASVITPTVTVKDTAGNVLTKDIDYTVSYSSGRRNVGTYDVTVTFKGNYSGSKTLSFKITPMDISKCTVKLSATSLTYNAKVRTPTVTITNPNGAKLTKDTHYTVTYAEGRRNVGTYNVTVTLTGNYKGTKILSFKITPMDISKCTVKLSATSYTYNAYTRTPAVTVKNSNGATLTKDTHYTVTYDSGRKNVGTYNVTVTLKGNYTGTKTLSFEITPMDISDCTVKLSATSYTYNAYTRTPAVTVKNSNGATLTKGTHYTVTYDAGRKNVGTYNVTVTLKGNYTGTKTLSFEITPMDISDCTVKLSYTSYTYNGSVKTPAVTITNPNGAKLTKDTHYTVSYASGRKNVGTYKVTVTLKGNYTGTKTLTFKIYPPKTTVASLVAGTKSITVNLNKQTNQVTGYQIQYSTNKDFTDAKTKTITSNSTVKTTLSSLTSGKTYYVRVRTYKTVNDVKYYSGWSEYKYVKVK